MIKTSAQEAWFKFASMDPNYQPPPGFIAASMAPPPPQDPYPPIMPPEQQSINVGNTLAAGLGGGLAGAGIVAGKQTRDMMHQLNKNPAAARAVNRFGESGMGSGGKILRKMWSMGKTPRRLGMGAGALAGAGLYHLLKSDE